MTKRIELEAEHERWMQCLTSSSSKYLRLSLLYLAEISGSFGGFWDAG